MRIERRLELPRWLLVAVPIGSLLFAFAAMAVVLAATGHDPGATYRRLFDAAFVADGALTSTLVFSTPLVFTGLAAAAAFRMQLYNIGGEGQFYLGAVAALGIGLYLGDLGVNSTWSASRPCASPARSRAGSGPRFPASSGRSRGRTRSSPR